MSDAPSPPESGAPAQQPTILIVDDEEGVLNALRRLLRRENYRIFCAGDAGTGLSILEQNTVDLVISDQRMPQMEGTVFLQKIKERWPDTLRVILSGYAEPSLIVESINKGEVYRFFPKPWDDEELKTGIRQCVAHHELQAENRRLLLQVRQQNEDLRRMNYGLEDMVQARTLSLLLAQEIVEIVPSCIFGVSPEGEVLLCNAAAQRAIHEWQGVTVMPGAPAEEILPPQVFAVFQQVLTDQTPHECEPLLIHNRPYHVFCTPLGNAGQRGLLLVLRDSQCVPRTVSN